jgi:hypothetical protein
MLLTPIPLRTLKPGYSLGISIDADTLSANNLALVLTHKGSCRIVRGLSALKGSVHLRNPTEALVFVRLRTSESTARFMTGSPWAEVVPVAAVMTPTGPTVRGRPMAVGLQGEIPAADFYRLGFAAPSATRTLDGFKVTRYVVIGGSPGQPGHVEAVSELIQADGGYRVVGRKLCSMQVQEYCFWSTASI